MQNNKKTRAFLKSNSRLLNQMKTLCPADFPLPRSSAFIFVRYPWLEDNFSNPDEQTIWQYPTPDVEARGRY
jgi:hypothetical protein